MILMLITMVFSYDIICKDKCREIWITQGEWNFNFDSWVLGTEVHGILTLTLELFWIKVYLVLILTLANIYGFPENKLLSDQHTVQV